MVDINPELQRRLASWRSTAGVAEASVGSGLDHGFVRAHMRAQNGLLRALLLDVVSELDTTFSAVADYLDQGKRSPLHEQRLDERTAAALLTYERAVARVLDGGISAALHDLPREREVIKYIYLQQPRAKGWFQRLFGG